MSDEYAEKTIAQMTRFDGQANTMPRWMRAKRKASFTLLRRFYAKAPPPTIHHYTSSAALISIVANNEISEPIVVPPVVVYFAVVGTPTICSVAVIVLVCLLVPTEVSMALAGTPCAMSASSMDSAAILADPSYSSIGGE